MFGLLAFYYDALAGWEQALNRFWGITQPPHPNLLLVLLNWWGTTQGMVTITIAGVVLLILLYRRTLEVLLLAGGMLGGWAFIELTKLFFAKPRPAGFQLFEATGYSFPSGHAFITVLFVALFSYLSWPAVKERLGSKNFAQELRPAVTRKVNSSTGFPVGARIRMAQVTPALVLIILTAAVLATGWSRVYFGVHYWRDVLGGWLAGAFWAVVWVIMAQKVK